jgi:hypothetical protein
MDDINITGTDPAKYKECFEFIEREALAIGLKVNHRKCEFFSNHPLPAGMPDVMYRDRQAGDTIRILGAYMGKPASVIAVLMEAVDKTAQLFENVKALGGHEALVGLSQTLVPQVSFILRTHPPEETKAVAERFDELIADALSYLAELQLDEVSRTISSLPTNMGGLGFTSAKDAALPAYTASRAESLACDAASQSAAPHQKELMTAIHRNNAALLSQHPTVRKTLEEAGSPGTAGFLRRTSDNPLEPPIVGALVRGRLGSIHEHLIGTILKCPGCGIDLDRQTAVAHVMSCVRVKGRNTSSAHAVGKAGMTRIIRSHGVRVQEGEPREFQSIKCPACSAEVPECDVAHHHTVCAEHVTLEQLHSARRSGPDIRVFWPNGESWVYDYTSLSHVLTGSGGSVEGSHHKREKAKRDMYEARVIANGESFAVLSFTRAGGPNKDVVDLAQRLALTSDGATAADILEEFVLNSQIANAMSLINAEDHMGCPHRFQFKHELAAGNALRNGNGRDDPATRALFGSCAATPAFTAVRFPTATTGLEEETLDPKEEPEEEAPPPEVESGSSKTEQFLAATWKAVVSTLTPENAQRTEVDGRAAEQESASTTAHESRSEERAATGDSPRDKRTGLIGPNPDAPLSGRSGHLGDGSHASATEVRPKQPIPPTANPAVVPRSESPEEASPLLVDLPVKQTSKLTPTRSQAATPPVPRNNAVVEPRAKPTDAPEAQVKKRPQEQTTSTKIGQRSTESRQTETAATLKRPPVGQGAEMSPSPNAKHPTPVHVVLNQHNNTNVAPPVDAMRNGHGKKETASSQSAIDTPQQGTTSHVFGQQQQQHVNGGDRAEQLRKAAETVQLKQRQDATDRAKVVAALAERRDALQKANMAEDARKRGDATKLAAQKAVDGKRRAAEAAAEKEAAATRKATNDAALRDESRRRETEQKLLAQQREASQRRAELAMIARRQSETPATSSQATTMRWWNWTVGPHVETPQCSIAASKLGHQESTSPSGPWWHALASTATTVAACVATASTCIGNYAIVLVTLWTFGGRLLALLQPRIDALFPTGRDTARAPNTNLNLLDRWEALVSVIGASYCLLTAWTSNDPRAVWLSFVSLRWEALAAATYAAYLAKRRISDGPDEFVIRFNPRDTCITPLSAFFSELGGDTSTAALHNWHNIRRFRAKKDENRAARSAATAVTAVARVANAYLLSFSFPLMVVETYANVRHWTVDGYYSTFEQDYNNNYGTCFVPPSGNFIYITVHALGAIMEGAWCLAWYFGHGLVTLAERAGPTLTAYLAFSIAVAVGLQRIPFVSRQTKGILERVGGRTSQICGTVFGSVLVCYVLPYLLALGAEAIWRGFTRWLWRAIWGKAAADATAIASLMINVTTAGKQWPSAVAVATTIAMPTASHLITTCLLVAGSAVVGTAVTSWQVATAVAVATKAAGAATAAATTAIVGYLVTVAMTFGTWAQPFLLTSRGWLMWNFAGSLTAVRHLILWPTAHPGAATTVVGRRPRSKRQP